MSDKRDTITDDQSAMGPRIYVDPELVPQIEEYRRKIHRGTFKAAANALMVQGLSAIRAEKPHTTPAVPAQA